MMWPTPLLWIMRHVLGHEPGDRADLKRSRQSVDRANRAADLWDQHVRDGLAIQREREFWQHHHEEPTRDDRP